MAAIYLIRHGQASFGKADYDKLSQKGIEQAKILGKHWQSLAKPEQVFSGTLLRQKETAEHFFSAFFATKNIAAYSQDGFLVSEDAGFNEFNHLDVLAQYKAEWQNPLAISEYITLHKKEHTKSKNDAFQQEFMQAFNRWMSGEYDGYQESWQQFKQRCIDALQKLIQQAASKQVVTQSKNGQSKNSQCKSSRSGKLENIFVFTSAGTISVIIQHILGLSDQQALRVSQQLVNTGVTKLLFSGDRLSVDYINNYSHLELAGCDWVTYR